MAEELKTVEEEIRLILKDYKIYENYGGYRNYTPDEVSHLLLIIDSLRREIQWLRNRKDCYQDNLNIENKE